MSFSSIHNIYIAYIYIYMYIHHNTHKSHPTWKYADALCEGFDLETVALGGCGRFALPTSQCRRTLVPRLGWPEGSPWAHREKKRPHTHFGLSENLRCSNKSIFESFFARDIKKANKSDVMNLLELWSRTGRLYATLSAPDDNGNAVDLRLTALLVLTCLSLFRVRGWKI